jgi:hypothetical protein
MKKVLVFFLLLFSLTLVYGQNQQPPAAKTVIDRNNLKIRPNSRDYTMVRKGNNHQRILQLHTHAMMLRKQAILNRKQAMDRRREYLQTRMIKQQQNRQRMIRHQSIHR